MVKGIIVMRVGSGRKICDEGGVELLCGDPMCCGCHS